MEGASAEGFSFPLIYLEISHHLKVSTLRLAANPWLQPRGWTSLEDLQSPLMMAYQMSALYIHQ